MPPFVNRMLRAPLFAVAVFSALCFGASLSRHWAEPVEAAEDSGILRATLPNGLRVIIVRNRLAPVVATSVNYLVGSNETPDGFPGTAHALEHMMFRGSPGLTADQLAAIGSVMGGNFNANTREELTQYLFTVPSEDLDVALHIEALRMADLSSTEADWANERGAISQEVAQDMSSPDYVMFAKLRATMFAGTPYEHDALGTRPSFEKTTAADLRKFHETWYAPNNAILILVGDIDPQATLAKVKTLFGDIKAKKLPARPVIKEQPIKAANFSFDTDRPNGSVVLAMRMPGLNSADFPALEVLADAMASERGELYQLVPQGKSLGTTFSLDPLPKAGMAYAAAAFADGQDSKALEGELRRILTNIAQNGIPPELVAAAKLQERRAAEFQKNSIAGLASIWAEAVAVYGLNAPDDDLVRIQKVTVDDVKRVAKKYLDLSHAITVVMVPRGSGAPVAGGGGFGGQETIALGEADATKLPDWAESALANLQVPASTIHPVVSTLPNGLTLIVQPEDVSDSVTVYGHIKTRQETQTPPGKEGVAQVLGDLFSYGTEHLDRLAYQTALDEIGAGQYAGADFSVETLTENFDRGVELLADNELHPALPQDAMSVIQNQMAQVVAGRNRSPAYLTTRSLRLALFPDTDPSLRDSTPESLRSLTLDDVRAYYRAVFRPDMATIVVIGNITPEKARATIEKYFGGWTASGPKPQTDLPTVPPNKPGAVAVPDVSRVQDQVTLAHTLGLTRLDNDYYALQMGSAVLGGGFYSTRLSVDLRKNAGLVYSVGSDLQAGKTRSVYMVNYASDPGNVSKASAIVVRDLKAMQSAPVSDSELARIKALMLRQLPLGESSIASIARAFAARRDLDLPLDEPTNAARHYIAIQPADIQAAFKKWIRPDDLVRVTRGPAPG